MSELGLCSRREADEWIARGWVRVDGVVVSELGSKVLPSQKVTVERQAAAEQSKRVTILINKPMGYVSGQAEDGYRRRGADQAGKPLARRPRAEQFHPTQLRSLVPAGRLDIDSVGLLVLTQDGRVAKQLIGETPMDKEYLVRVEYTKAGQAARQRPEKAEPRPVDGRQAAAAGQGALAERRPAASRCAKARSARSAACATWSA
jgi:23S rRNA pseudouridine2604 synthase